MLFSNCSKDTTLSDPCANVTCLNGGTCANGSCNCPTGFTGSDCGTRRTPSKILITKIQVTAFPPTDGGAGWDLTSGADIYPKILFVSSVLWDSPNYIENANASSSYDFTPSPAIQISNPTLQYTIELWDYDTTDPDDFMAGFNFTPYNGSSAPSVINLTSNTNGLTIKLSVQYVY